MIGEILKRIFSRRTEPASVNPQRITWTDKDQHRAFSDGWGIFDSDERGLEIQRLDDPSSVNAEWPAEPRFTGDDQAEKYVRQSADDGNELCRKALDYLQQEANIQ
ncbi:MAG: hypothetical protein DI537_13950 [Stutzerimonas stutzeri]|nr:MAG: hypothetical protein DI537_13950 [Stutzerimonas stutzeri]